MKRLFILFVCAAGVIGLMPLDSLAYEKTPQGIIITRGKGKGKAKGRVAVTGLNGIDPTDKTTIKVQNTNSTNPGVATADLEPGQTKTGKGRVDIDITAHDLGTTSINISGLYGQFNVDVDVPVEVLEAILTQSQSPWHATAGDPVSTLTGEFYGLESLDVHLGGPMPLYFARYYASLLAIDNRIDGSLGRNRTHNFASTIKEVSLFRQEIILPSGRAVTFEKIGGKWVLLSPLDTGYTLAEAPGGQFLLGFPDTQHIWTYNADGRLILMEDRNGNNLQLTYNLSGQLISVADPLGRVLQFQYTGGKITSIFNPLLQVTFAYTGDNLTSATNISGKTTTYDYDPLDRLLSRTLPEGNTPFTQTHDDEKVVSQTERGTDTSLIDYHGDSATFTDPTGQTLFDAYDDEGRLISHTDEAGKAITMTYDSAGRRNSVTDRLGDTTTITYHARSGLPAVITNAEGGKTTLTYKSRSGHRLIFDDLVKVTRPDGSSISFLHDAKGNVRQITDPAGKVWKFTRNDRGQVLTATNPNGGVATFTYDPQGRLKTARDPDTEDITYNYDSLDRITSVNFPNGQSLNLTYNGSNLVTGITDERGFTHSFAYDDNNRLASVTDPATNATQLAYDTLDRVINITDRNGGAVARAYNSLRLPDSVTDRNSKDTTFQYDERRRPVGITDPDGHLWPREYDDEGQLVSIATPIDPPAKFRRNRLGQVTEASTPLGHTTYFVRDAMQRVIRRFDPLGRQTAYTYDKRGLVTSVSEQGTGTGKYSYDNLGNLTRIIDPAGGVWTRAYTPAGRLASEIDPLGSQWNLEYDILGRHNKTTFPDGTTLILSRDGAGNITRREYSNANGPDINYNYDNRNRLVAATDISFTYDAEGRVTHCDQFGKTFEATHDLEGRPLTLTYFDNALTVTYAYDDRGLLAQVTDSLSGALVTFNYDEARRLTGVTRSNGVHGAYTHDADGRITRIEEGSIITLDCAYNAAGELRSLEIDAPSLPAPPAGVDLYPVGKTGQVGVGHLYDSLGRLTSAEGETFIWDGASRLISADGVPLTYNGVDDLSARAPGGITTQLHRHYALPGNPIVYEQPLSGTDPERAYIWTPDGLLLYSIEIGVDTPVFYHFDHLGSTLALTDESGTTITDSYAYGPYGELLEHNGSSTQPFTYLGAHGVRREGNLYQMGARFYDPRSARFLSRDPLPPRPGDLKSLNPYAYAALNPLKYIDPTGNEPEFSTPDICRTHCPACGLPSSPDHGVECPVLVNRGPSCPPGVLAKDPFDCQGSSPAMDFLLPAFGRCSEGFFNPCEEPPLLWGCGDGAGVVPPSCSEGSDLCWPLLPDCDQPDAACTLPLGGGRFQVTCEFKSFNTRPPTEAELRLLPRVFVLADDMKRWAEEDKANPPAPAPPKPKKTPKSPPNPDRESTRFNAKDYDQKEKDKLREFVPGIK